MRIILFSVLIVASSSFSHAHLLPFGLGNFWSTKPQTPLSADVVTLRSPRIAIIGAGAGGSSAAFWIAKAKERHGLDIAIDIYERSDYIGGRKLL